MKYITFVLLLMSSTTTFAHDSKVISAVKKNPQIAAYLKEAAQSASNTITFHQMPLDGICGFAGCESRELVNIKVTSSESNAPAKSMLAVVSYMELSESAPIKVSVAKLSY